MQIYQTILQSPAVSQDHDHGSEPEAESERYQLSIPSIKKCRDFPEFNFNLSAGCHLEIEKDEHGCTKSTRIKCDENVTLKVDCDENEEFKECGNCNEKQCGDPESSTPSDQIACDESPCFPKCQCLESFVRNEENKCVKSAQCPKIAKDRCKLRPDSGFCRNKFERCKIVQIFYHFKLIINLPSF